MPKDMSWATRRRGGTEPVKRGPVKREDIVAAAATAFARSGYRGATLEDIAKLVGIQKASLYHHINSKEELLLEILESGLMPTLRDLETISESDRSPCGKLYYAVYQHVMHTADKIETHAVFVNDFDVISDGNRRKAYLAKRKRYENLMADIVKDCLEANSRETDPRLVTLAILGMCNYMPRWFREKDVNVAEKIASVFADLAKEMVGCAS